MLYTLFSIAAAASVVTAQTSTIVPAPVVSNSPLGTSYVATLPEKGTVRGSIAGTSATDGKGVNFAVSISGLPAEGGPFMYHIHEKPVPTDGNCTGTGAHLDPYKRGEVPPCDPTQKETCQTGDLSGKYGTFDGPEGTQSYLDLYSSTDPADPSYFGDLSIVIHFANKTRITCANFTVSNVEQSSSISSGYALPTGTGSANQTGTAKPTFTSAEPTQPSEPTDSPQPTSGASRMMIAGAGVLAGAVAMVL